MLLRLILALHQCLFSSSRCHSSSFRYIPVPFLSIPFYSAVIPACSGTLRYHSCPFRFIPASFCLVPVYSGLFRYIPFRSIPFHSVPVFSNTQTEAFPLKVWMRGFIVELKHFTSKVKLVKRPYLGLFMLTLLLFK